MWGGLEGSLTPHVEIAALTDGAASDPVHAAGRVSVRGGAFCFGPRSDDAYLVCVPLPPTPYAGPPGRIPDRTVPARPPR